MRVGGGIDKDYVYRAEYFTLPAGLQYVNRIRVYQDRVYLDGYDMEKDSRYQIFSIHTNGADSKIVYEQPEDKQSSTHAFTLDPEGNLVLFQSHYGDGTAQSGEMQNYFVKLDAEGNELSVQEVKGAQDFSAQDMQIDKEGRRYLLSSGRLLIYDNEGRQLADIDTSVQPINDMFMTDEGKVMLRSYNKDQTATEVKEFIPEQKTFSEPYGIEGTLSGMRLFNGAAGYDFFIADSSDLYSYDLKTKEKTKMINWLNSDINGYDISAIAALPDNQFLCIANNRITNTCELSLLSKVSPEDVAEKEVLTLAGAVDDVLINAAVSFNKKSDRYRIVVKNYDNYTTPEDPLAGVKKLNSDIISGDIPDIVGVLDQSAFESMVSKGLFADIYELMAQDESFHKEDYLENIFTALEKDGKLYRAAPYFNIFTVVGKTADVGEEMGWTIEDFYALAASKPEDTRMFADFSNERALSYGLQFSLDQYIDWKTYEAGFDKPEFIKFLEFANQFPSQEELDQQKNNINRGDVQAFLKNREKTEAEYREGKILLKESNLSDFSELRKLQERLYGDEVTFIGFPTDKKNGSAFFAYAQLAISNESDGKDGAWEFLKTVYSDEIQDYAGMASWPVKLSSLEKKKEKEQNETDGSLDPVTEEEFEKVMALLRSLTTVVNFDESIYQIVLEESSAYFAGQASAEDAAEIIQDRVMTYLNEIK